MGKSTMCKKLFCQADAMQIAAGKVRLWDVARYMRDDLSFEEALRKTMTQSIDFEFDKADIARFFSLLILMDWMSVAITEGKSPKRSHYGDLVIRNRKLL